jgi:hypothetical protein
MAIQNKLIEQHPIHTEYFGTSDGEVISYKGKHPKFIVQCNHQRGYTQFQISHSRYTRTHFLTHRFIFECFFGEIEEGMCVHHINHIKTDNSIDNLMLVTDAENRRYAKEYGIKVGGASDTYKKNKLKKNAKSIK